MRRTLGKLFGYGWTAGLSGRGVALAFFGALVAGTLAVACGVRVWPIRNDPAFDPPTSPAVRREGDRLVFDPPTAYAGKPSGGGRNGAYVSSLRVSPAGPPVAGNVGELGLSPEGVVLRGAVDSDVLQFTPSAYERAERTLYGTVYVVVALVPLPIFWAAARLLILARRARPRPPNSGFGLVVRAFVPAFAFSGAAGLAFPLNQPPWVVFGTLFAVAGANLLFGVADGASPPPRPSK